MQVKVPVTALYRAQTQRAVENFPISGLHLSPHHIAALGQIIFLQNLGNLSTYNAHENVGMFSAAALLIGGAAVSKATVGQALMGTVLFHLLFNVSPMAGKNLFGSAEIGE